MKDFINRNSSKELFLKWLCQWASFIMVFDHSFNGKNRNNDKYMNPKSYQWTKLHTKNIKKLGLNKCLSPALGKMST